MTVTSRAVLYDEATGEILDLVTRSDLNWFSDYSRPAGVGLRNLTTETVEYATHYFVFSPPADPVLTARPVIGMGSDGTLDGDGTSQTVATSLPSGTVVYRDGINLGTFSGTLTWDPTSPGDDGLHRYDLEPPFPDARETIWVTVVAP